MGVTAERAISSVLATINAPRPLWLTPEGLLDCLLADHPDPRWQPHIEAFFDECSHESLHDLVLAGVTNFLVLERALDVWSQGEAHTAFWVREMASLTRYGDQIEPVRGEAAGRQVPQAKA